MSLRILPDDMKGIFAASVTPFADDGKINESAFRALLEKNIAEGVTGFFIGGSSGKCFLLSADERLQVFRGAAEYRDRVKLIAHVGAISTDEAILYAGEAKRLGYHAISSTAPFYYKFPVKAVIRYFNDISEAAGMPLIIYNFPGNTGFEFNLSDPAVRDFLRSDTVVGVKHTNLNVFQMERIKNLKPSLLMYNGFDEVFTAGLAMGADGAIGSTFNVMYPHYRKIHDAFKALKNDEALTLQIKANNIMEAFCTVGLFPSIKHILTLQGIDAGVPRRPFLPLDSDEKRYIEKVWNDNIIN